MGREFSTDGTRLGALIAETMGVDSEDEIIRIGQNEHRRQVERSLTGADEEQADWDEDTRTGTGSS